MASKAVIYRVGFKLINDNNWAYHWALCLKKKVITSGIRHLLLVPS